MSDNPLVKYLKNNPVRKTAVDAQVSTATITRLLDPEPVGKESESLTRKEIEKWSIRKKRGFIQSVIKLCVYAEVDERATLKCYELGSTDEEIDKFISTIKDEIEEQGSKKTLNNLRVGICAWEPFFESNLNTENTWAARYCNRLLKGIEPTLSIDFLKVTNIDEAIEQLRNSERKNVQHLDVVFGLYETPSRIYEGLDFIPLPGIEMEMGCIYPCTKTKSWGDFILLLHNKDANIKPLVIKDDIGYGFIAGGCGVDLSNPIDPNDPDVLTGFDVGKLLKTFLSKNYRYFNGETSTFYPLVVEKGTATKVLDKLKYEPQLSEFLTDEGRNKLNEVVKSGLLSSDEAPSYRVGIAVSHQCKKIRANLISYCQKHELFKNTLKLTAIEYMNLLSRDLSEGNKAIKLCHPASDFPIHYWNKLLKALKSVKTEHVHRNYTTWVINVEKEYIDKYTEENDNE